MTPIRFHPLLTAACLLLGLAACAASATSPNPTDGYEQVPTTTIMETPDARADARYPAELLAQGRYLVNLLACGSCHTDGALIGEPNPDRLLAGSAIGIAFTNPMEDGNPGIVYPSNLTPDPETGLGGWSEQQIIDMIRTGAQKHGATSLSVMPWPAYASIKDEDAAAIAAYLLSLPPVRHAVPGNVAPGNAAYSPYVHFGTYRSLQ